MINEELELRWGKDRALWNGVDQLPLEDRPLKLIALIDEENDASSVG